LFACHIYSLKVFVNLEAYIKQRIQHHRQMMDGMTDNGRAWREQIILELEEILKRLPQQKAA